MNYNPYYGDYSAFLANNLYFILLIPVMLLSLWAQFKVSSSFRRFSEVMNSRRMTGYQAARLVLQAYGVSDVGISRCAGSLTDHYDPRDNTIYLSEPVYNEATVAAIGVAAHEAGHAVQYAEGYQPIRVRNAIIPMTKIGSQFSFILLLIGILLYSQRLFLLGIILFSFTTLFQLITLPVEFNASARAVETLSGSGLLQEEELAGVRKVLSAAALTYVASLLMSVLQLFRYLLIFASRSGRRGGRR